MTAWPTKPATRLQAGQRRPARRGGRSTEARAASARKIPTTDVTTRFTNSTSAWYDAGATTDVLVQRGQLGQPRPEPVRRPAAPLTTMAAIATAATTASRRKAVGVTTGMTIRGPSLGAGD